ncbi:hypothetical protein AB0T83_16320 [Fluviibacterium sp. DFM31]|uniref:ABC transporter permease n=1 Tax=Meridianimarinicoccus marinus TaxID=3231483 RepID=A0ABV3LD35_9RHOB
MTNAMPQPRPRKLSRTTTTRMYFMRNPSLLVGLLLVGSLLAFSFIGSFFVDERMARPLSAPPSQAPGASLLFGSDSQVRDLFAVLVYGTWLTVRLGLIAGAIGILVGGSLGLIAAYFHG